MSRAKVHPPFVGQPREDFSAIESLLREIRDEIRLLRESRQPRRGDDYSDLRERLLPALAGRFGSAAFTTSEAIADPAIHALMGHRDIRKAGNLLSRLCGHTTADGLELSRCDSEHNRALWVACRLVQSTRPSSGTS